jgi:hypothetical protein
MKVRYLFALTLASILIFTTLPSFSFPREQIFLQIEEINETIFPELSLEEYERVDVSVAPSLIYLSSECYSLTMVTSTSQTDSIQNGLDKVIKVRPNSHDLISEIFKSLAIKVLFVKVSSFEGDTYYARILLLQENKIIDLDARPSDSIAIAVRADAPVYVKKELLENFGQKIC